MKIFYVLLLGFLVVSCADIQRTEQLSKIDAMNETLDSLEQVFITHQIDTMAQLKHSAYQVENRIKTYYVSDTINMELGRKMDEFKKMRKRFGPMGRATGMITNGIKEEREKLELLKNDIDNGNGERDKYDEHLQFEQGKVDQLRVLTEDYVDMKTTSLETFNNLYDELNAFSLSLVKK